MIPRSRVRVRHDVRFIRYPIATLLALAVSGALAPATAAAAPMPQQAGRPAGRDTVRARPDLAAARADSLFTRLFGPGSDLGLSFNGRFEFKGERTRNERCVASQFFVLGAQCNAPWQAIPEFQFGLKTGGTIAERVRTEVDYDSRREFDGSNRIALSYQGKPNEWLQRIDVGNVTFDIAPSRFITSGVPQELRRAGRREVWTSDGAGDRGRAEGHRAARPRVRDRRFGRTAWFARD